VEYVIVMLIPLITREGRASMRNLPNGSEIVKQTIHAHISVTSLARILHPLLFSNNE